ncbi:MAG: hypothetical protein IKS41_04715 [Alphaproteobacteria bacterium]|nr:hypothetical protein [Alphaproteobacteria bacterium]
MKKFNYKSDYKKFNCDEFVRITFINEGAIFTKNAQIILIDNEKISFVDKEDVYTCISSEILYMKKLKKSWKVLYVLIGCVFFAYIFYLAFDFFIFTPSTNIPKEKIPSDKLATKREQADSITYVYHTQNDKMCVCRAEECVERTHSCTDWVKEYDNDGKLRGYTAYNIKSIDGNVYSEVKRYEIIFYRNGRIYSIGNDTLGVEYFDERGNLIRKCDGFYEGLIGRRTCEEYDKEQKKWIKKDDFWIT